MDKRKEMEIGWLGMRMDVVSQKGNGEDACLSSMGRAMEPIGETSTSKEDIGVEWGAGHQTENGCGAGGFATNGHGNQIQVGQIIVGPIGVGVGGAAAAAAGGGGRVGIGVKMDLMGSSRIIESAGGIGDAWGRCVGGDWDSDEEEGWLEKRVEPEGGWVEKRVEPAVRAPRAKWIDSDDKGKEAGCIASLGKVTCSKDPWNTPFLLEDLAMEAPVPASAFDGHSDLYVFDGVNLSGDESNVEGDFKEVDEMIWPEGSCHRWPEQVGKGETRQAETADTAAAYWRVRSGPSGPPPSLPSPRGDSWTAASHLESATKDCDSHSDRRLFVVLDSEKEKRVQFDKLMTDRPIRRGVDNDSNGFMEWDGGDALFCPLSLPEEARCFPGMSDRNCLGSETGPSSRQEAKKRRRNQRQRRGGSWGPYSSDKSSDGERHSEVEEAEGSDRSRGSSSLLSPSHTQECEECLYLKTPADLEFQLAEELHASQALHSYTEVAATSAEADVGHYGHGRKEFGWRCTSRTEGENETTEDARVEQIGGCGRDRTIENGCGTVAAGYVTDDRFTAPEGGMAWPSASEEEYSSKVKGAAEGAVEDGCSGCLKKLRSLNETPIAMWTDSGDHPEGQEVMCCTRAGDGGLDGDHQKARPGPQKVVAPKKTRQRKVRSVRLGDNFNVRDEHIIKIVDTWGCDLKEFELGSHESGDGGCVTEVAIKAIGASCPLLTKLTLHSVTKVGDACVNDIFEGCPQLQRLILTGNRRIKGMLTSKLLRSLASNERLLPNLREIIVTDQPRIENQAAQELSEARQQLVVKIGDSSMCVFAADGISTFGPQQPPIILAACSPPSSVMAMMEDLLGSKAVAAQTPLLTLSEDEGWEYNAVHDWDSSDSDPFQEFANDIEILNLGAMDLSCEEVR